jgi:hypothetical protein
MLMKAVPETTGGGAVMTAVARANLSLLNSIT